MMFLRAVYIYVYIYRARERERERERDLSASRRHPYQQCGWGCEDLKGSPLNVILVRGMSMYIYVYIERARERGRERKREPSASRRHPYQQSGWVSEDVKRSPLNDVLARSIFMCVYLYIFIERESERERERERAVSFEKASLSGIWLGV